MASALVLAAACWSTPSRADTFAPLHPVRQYFWIDLGYGRLDEAQSRANDIGKSGFAFGVKLDTDLFDLVSLSGSFSTIFAKDHKTFDQAVVNQAGETNEAESTLNVYLLGLAAGLRTPNLVLGDPDSDERFGGLWATARYGYGWQSASRSISNCGDCKTEDLEFDNGPFVEGAVNVGAFTEILGLVGNLSYRQYLGDSAGNFAINAGMGFSWF